MPISLTCSCGKRLTAKDQLAGKRVKCPGCGQGLEVPTAEPDVLQMIEVPPEEPETAAYTVAGLDSAGASRLEDEELAETRPMKPMSRKLTRSVRSVAASRSSARSYLYFLLLVALLPLLLSFFLKNREDVGSRLQRTLVNLPEEAAPRIEKAMASEDAGLDELLSALPGGKIEGAHLPRKTWRHYLYAVLSAIAFLGLILAIFPRGLDRIWTVFLIGTLTGTIGILLLLIVQRIAASTEGVWVHGRGILVLLFYFVKLIGFSYRSAFDPESNFALSFLGFTFGVGLCEEVCKAAPVFWQYRRHGLAWQEACLWGLASGVGFGVAEGIFYCADFYNGLHGVEIYLVRFISCVALHAIWSASVALTTHANQGLIHDAEGWAENGLVLLRVVAVVMVMHGLYDTLLKKDMNLLAFGLALAGFGWLAWQIERMRATEGEEPEVESAAS